VEVLKRDRYRRLRSGGHRDSGVDVSDLHGLRNAPHGCRDADGHILKGYFYTNLVGTLEARNFNPKLQSQDELGKKSSNRFGC
jgi:hypothetical protein